MDNTGNPLLLNRQPESKSTKLRQTIYQLVDKAKWTVSKLVWEVNPKEGKPEVKKTSWTSINSKINHKYIDFFLKHVAIFHEWITNDIVGTDKIEILWIKWHESYTITYRIKWNENKYFTCISDDEIKKEYLSK